MIALGIHDGHDAAAALLVEGVIVAAAQEERYTRLKNQGGFPSAAIGHVLASQGLTRSEVDVVAVASRHSAAGLTPPDGHSRDAVRRHHESILEGKDVSFRVKTKLGSAPGVLRARRAAQARARRHAYRELFPTSRVVLVDHHECHASAAYFGGGTGEERVLVLTADGDGDDLSGSVSIGSGGRLRRLAAISREDSLGWVYEAVTYLLGMQPYEDEHKVMGLAPYGSGASHADDVARGLQDLYELDGDLRWSRRSGVPSMNNPTRVVAGVVTGKRFDRVAAGVQQFLEEMLVGWVRQCVKATGVRRLAVSGGVFLNVKANAALLALPEVEDLFVTPGAGDASNAIGACYAASARLEPQAACRPLGPLYLGDDVDARSVENLLAARDDLDVSWPSDPEKEVARLLVQGEIVGRAGGRMEFGPRALGNRSLLADPSRASIVRVLNSTVKSRDFWMPFSPVIPAEDADRFVVKPKDHRSPNMTIVYDVRPERREDLVAALHPADDTARVQELDADANPSFHRLLRHFEAMTGRSALLNTSLNVHGMPIVRTAEDALGVLQATNLRHLQLGRAIVSKRP